MKSAMLADSMTQAAPHIATWAVGIVLLLAGLAKLIFRRQFADAFSALMITPPSYVRRAALGISLMESIVALGLLLGLAPTLFAAAAAALFFVFAGIVLRELTFRRGMSSTSCRCFGFKSTITWGTFVRNLGLSMASLAAFPNSPYPLGLLITGAVAALLAQAIQLKNIDESVSAAARV